MSLRDLITVPWLVFSLVWIAGIAWRKRAVRRESRLDRMVHLGQAAVAGWLLTAEIAWRPLALPLYTTGLGLFVLSVVCVWSGVALAIWARFLLGGNWSAAVTVKDDHQLIRRGPYGLVRHPIYTGILLAALGTALAIGRVRGFVAVAIFFWSFLYKSRREEAFMREQFGEEYDRYRQEVRAALVPFVF